MVTLSTQSTKYVDLALARANQCMYTGMSERGEAWLRSQKKTSRLRGNRGPLDGST